MSERALSVNIQSFPWHRFSASFFSADEQSHGGTRARGKNKTESFPRDEFLRVENGRSLSGAGKNEEKVLSRGSSISQRAKWNERDTNRFWKFTRGRSTPRHSLREKWFTSQVNHSRLDALQTFLWPTFDVSKYKIEEWNVLWSFIAAICS